jgi:hypothetical protein
VIEIVKTPSSTLIASSNPTNVVIASNNNNHTVTINQLSDTLACSSARNNITITAGRRSYNDKC